MNNKVTYEMMEEFIIKREWQIYDDSTVTMCFLTMKNGIIVVGKSACIDESTFDEQIGKELAESDAFNKCWQLFGFQLASERKGLSLMGEPDRKVFYVDVGEENE